MIRKLVSYHLLLLRSQGIVSSQHDGKLVIYSCRTVEAPGQVARAVARRVPLAQVVGFSARGLYPVLSGNELRWWGLGKVGRDLRAIRARGLCEIGGGYLVWGWMREGRVLPWAILGAVVLVLYGVVAGVLLMVAPQRS